MENAIQNLQKKKQTNTINVTENYKRRFDSDNPTNFKEYLAYKLKRENKV